MVIEIIEDFFLFKTSLNPDIVIHLSEVLIEYIGDILGFDSTTLKLVKKFYHDVFLLFCNSGKH